MLRFKPQIKDYKVLDCLDNMDTLMPELMRSKSIFFAPAGKVMPTKLFIGHAWNNNQALIKHMEAENFWAVNSMKDNITTRIREVLNKAPKPVITVGNLYKMASL